MCAGELSAVLSTVAAGFPMMLTLGLRLPLITPVNECRSGDCDGPGTITICVSFASIRSPCLAAGFPIVFAPGGLRR
jgi:hypothetical protein